MKSVDPTISEEALFRYSVVSQVLGLELAGQPATRAVDAVSSRLHYELNGRARRISERTLYRWLADYKEHGLGGLEATPRPRTSSSVVLPVDFLSFVVDQKEKDPDASVPELIRRAEMLGKIPDETSVVRQTVYRALLRLGVSTHRRKGCADRDSRPFAYPHRLNMVLADGKYFRAGAGRLKRVALFFLDDATRYGLHVVVGTSESTELFLRGLYELIRKYGIADLYYLDHGPGFIAHDTLRVIANLDRPLIHGEKKYPEGHGKIERFNQRAKAELLRHLSRPDVDPECRALELRLQHYLSEVYNRAPHDALQRSTPFERFHADAKPLSFPDNDEHLQRLFLVSVSRRVTSHHTIPIGSKRYEVPRGYAGQRIALFRHVLKHQVLFMHDGRFIELAEADLVANARARRSPHRKESSREVTHPLPKSAAELAYERDFAPVTDADGGFTGRKEH
jgi:transposase InsO family protein